MDPTNAILTVGIIAAAIAFNQYVIGPAVCRWFGDTDADDQDADRGDPSGFAPSDDVLDEEPVVTVTDEPETEADVEIGLATPAPVGRGVRRLARRVVARRAVLTGKN